MTDTVRYVDAANTAVVLAEVETHIIPRQGERLRINEEIVGRVQVTEYTIDDEDVVAIIKVQIHWDDTDESSVPEIHPRYVEKE